MTSLVLLSGGLDSTVALAHCVKESGWDNVAALTIQYGQRHETEIYYAIQQSQIYGVPHYHRDLSPVFMGLLNPLMGGNDSPMPQGPYDEKNVPATYIPFRNGLLLSAATSMAYFLGYDRVVIAAHRGDERSVYPDCSTDFLNAMQGAVTWGTDHKVNLYAPFVSKTKAEIVKLGHELGVNFSLTWSCYQGGMKPCQVCATCIDRRSAFEANGLDPQ